jgi:hypothetical protein
MIPLNQLSTTFLNAPFVEKSNNLNAPLIDYELGGVGLSDPSQGLKVKLWTLYLDGENDVKITAEGVPPVTLFSRAGIRELSLAFDQNMRPFVAFVQHTEAWFWWFDTATSSTQFTQLIGAVSPRCTLDDKRAIAQNTSDIILAYVKDNNLYMRYQRDRYTIEYLLRSDINATLVSVGMAKNNRLRFKMRYVNSIN